MEDGRGRDAHIHADGDHHELGVEADERLVLGEAVLLNESNLHAT